MFQSANQSIYSSISFAEIPLIRNSEKLLKISTFSLNYIQPHENSQRFIIIIFETISTLQPHLYTYPFRVDSGGCADRQTDRLGVFRSEVDVTVQPDDGDVVVHTHRRVLRMVDHLINSEVLVALGANFTGSARVVAVALSSDVVLAYADARQS